MATPRLREKLYDEAELDFRKGLALDPDNASIENDLGYMYADRGIKLDEAVTILKKAVNADPQNYAFLDSLAWAYYKQGQYAMAEDFERRASQRMTSDPTLLDHLGEIEAKNGKLQPGNRGLEQVAAGVLDLAWSRCRSRRRGACTAQGGECASAPGPTQATLRPATLLPSSKRRRLNHTHASSRSRYT